jgi:hypothetical protein
LDEVTDGTMPERVVSQRSIVAMTRVFGSIANRYLPYGELLYEHDFPDWFIAQATQRHMWVWPSLLMDLRRGTFCFVGDGIGGARCIVPNNVPIYTEGDAAALGERYIQRLAAFATTLPLSEELLLSLQLDGFDVDKFNWKLVPLEGPVSGQVEEDRLTRMVKNTGLPASNIILKHIEDAHSLYVEGKDHPSLNESRNLIQALIDDITIETDAHGKHPTKLPGGTANRIDYLKNVGFLTPDEEAALKSSWGSLSAGSHPGVPEREHARIGLVLALEFGQLLILKFTNWKMNAYRHFK